MSTKEEALERGRKLYAEIFESEFSDEVLTMLDDGSEVDNTLFAIFHDAFQEGYLVDITNWEYQHPLVQDDGTPLYVVSAKKLRTLMCAALTIGMWHQKVTNKLDNMWSD